MTCFKKLHSGISSVASVQIHDLCIAYPSGILESYMNKEQLWLVTVVLVSQF